MKKLKLILFATIILAFGLTLNTFGQPRTKRKQKSNKNARSTVIKGPRSSNYSFGATQTGTWFRNQQNNRNAKSVKVPRKPRKH